MTAIIAIGTSVPEFVATNEHVVSLVLDRSEGSYSGDIADLERDLRGLLERVGSRERRWRSGLSTPTDHVIEAWENCVSSLDQDSLGKIGALIYCGIDRGVAEPSHASLFARRLGLFDLRCLDISDACMGWYTAARAASRFASRSRPYCAVVSAEFPLEMPGKVYPPAFTIKSAEDLLWKGAALTLGEAASVAVIDPFIESAEVFRANSRHADACCVPLLRPERFVDSAWLLPRLIDDCFVAHLPTMASASYRDAQEVLKQYINENGIPDVVLPHTVSQPGPRHAARHFLPDTVIKNCFESFGNIATSSIPVGYEYFDCAADRTTHIAAWVSSAGMSHCAFRLF
jgi:3-oxoacyl-[acyl-carrier-protein] synthase III